MEFIVNIDLVEFFGRTHKKGLRQIGGSQRRRRDSNPRAPEGKRISSAPRYDRFDTSPYVKTVPLGDLQSQLS